MSLLNNIVVQLGHQATPQTPESVGFLAGILSILLLPWVFYCLLIIAIITIITFHEKEEIGWSHTIFILLIAYLCYSFNFDFKDLINNPLPIFKWVGTYLVIGIIWSFFKWFFYLKNMLASFNEIKNKFIKEIEDELKFSGISLQSDKIDLYKKELLNQKLQSYYGYYEKPIGVKKINIKETITVEFLNKLKKASTLDVFNYSITNPQAQNHKALITTWITHWPISCLWTIINDPIKKLINYVLIQKTFQKISDKIFKSVTTEL